MCGLNLGMVGGCRLLEYRVGENIVVVGVEVERGGCEWEGLVSVGDIRR